MPRSVASDSRYGASSLWLIPVVFAAILSHGLIFYFNRGPFTPDHPPSPDEAEYLSLGKSLAHVGRLELPTGEKAKRMPAYPALIAVISSFVDESDLRTAILAIQAALAAGSTILAAELARRLAAPRAAVVAGLTSALYAPFVYLQTLCLTETLFIFLLMASVLVFVIAHAAPTQTKRIMMLPVGALLGLLALTRANAAILVLPFLIDAFYRSNTWRERAASAVFLVLPTVLFLSGWALRNQREIGRFTVSTVGGLNLYLGHNPDYADDPGLAHADYAAFDRLRIQEGASEAQADQRLHDQGIAFIRENPKQTLANIWRKLLVYHHPGTTKSAPTFLLICIAAILFTPAAAYTVTPTSLLLRIRPAMVIAFVVVCVAWILELLVTFRPWVYPGHVLMVGLAALVLMRPQIPVRGLFVGLYLTELAVAVGFIPLIRLRWSTDILLIVASAVGLFNLFDYLKTPPGKSREK